MPESKKKKKKVQDPSFQPVDCQVGKWLCSPIIQLAGEIPVTPAFSLEFYENDLKLQEKDDRKH